MMYPNQAFPSGSYAEMLSGNSLLPHNFTENQNEVKFFTTVGDTVAMQSIDGHSNNAGGDPSYTRTPLGLVDNEQNIQSQGLSLSLGTLMPVPPFQYHYPSTGFSSLMTPNLPNFKGTVSLKDDEASAECMGAVSSGGFNNHFQKEALYNPHSSLYHKEVSNDPSCLHGTQGFSNVALNSQYLKAAQELLDEIVNVRKALKQPGLDKQKSSRDIGVDGSKESEEKSTSQSLQNQDPNASSANASCELSPAERQSLLDKKAKLLAMLDEVYLQTPLYYLFWIPYL